MIPRNKSLLKSQEIQKIQTLKREYSFDSKNQFRGDINKSNLKQILEMIPQAKGTKSPIKKKKKKAFMQFSMLTPLNLNSETQIFFEQKGLYDPQFIYSENVLNMETPYSKVDTEYLDISLKILNAYVREYGPQWNNDQGQLLTQEQTSGCFQRYIDGLGFQDLLEIEYKQNTVTPTMISHSKEKGIKSRIIIGLPIKYYENTILGVLNHEIGTHFIRKVNNRQQKWYKSKSKNEYKIQPYMTHEEGLAVLNQMYSQVISSKQKPFLYRAALTYYAAYLASTNTFQEIYQKLEKYLQDPDKRFQTCVRVKRGIYDTSKQGGMYKDQVYLKGAVEILKTRKRINFLEFHCGKLGLADYFKFTKFLKIDTKIMIKPYFLLDIDLYNRVLDKIALTNYIS